MVKVVQGARDIIFTHGSAPTESRPRPHRGAAGGVKLLPSSTQDVGETLDGNKSCDVAEAY